MPVFSNRLNVQVVFQQTHASKLILQLLEQQLGGCFWQHYLQSCSSFLCCGNVTTVRVSSPVCYCDIHYFGLYCSKVQFSNLNGQKVLIHFLTIILAARYHIIVLLGLNGRSSSNLWTLILLGRDSINNNS